MKGSGLDALAALCGATGRARTENEVTASSPRGNGAQVVTGVPSSGAPAPQILPDTAPPSVPLNFNAQQMQQVMAFGNAANPFAAASMGAVMQAAVATQPTPGNPASINTMQQLAYYQYIQFAAQAAALQAQAQVAARGNLMQQQPAQVPFDITKSAVPLTFASAAPQLSQRAGKPSMRDDVELFMVESRVTTLPPHHNALHRGRKQMAKNNKIYQNWKLIK